MLAKCCIGQSVHHRSQRVFVLISIINVVNTSVALFSPRESMLKQIPCSRWCKKWTYLIFDGHFQKKANIFRCTQILKALLIRTNLHVLINSYRPLAINVSQKDPVASTSLSTEISNAICLSYNCDDLRREQVEDKEWATMQESETSWPECTECHDLRLENERLKGIILDLKKIMTLVSMFSPYWLIKLQTEPFCPFRDSSM